METRIAEIAEGVYRLSTLVPEVAPPAGFTFNQFLLMADEPLLFHCGHRGMFETISGAVKTLMPIEKLRWISFSHFEADECGAMNTWLAAAPHAQVAHGAIGCDGSLNDVADRAPRVLQDDEVLDLGGKRVRFLATPHVPHGWDAGMMYEESAGTLLCSDILAHVGDVPVMTESDLVGPALAAEEMFRTMSVTPQTVATLERLAALKPKTLALMHGSSLTGDCAAALRGLADGLAERNGLRERALA
jgi:flavorubredoxin